VFHVEHCAVARIARTLLWSYTDSNPQPKRDPGSNDVPRGTIGEAHKTFQQKIPSSGDVSRETACVLE
jgi:hypothetical protein